MGLTIPKCLIQNGTKLAAPCLECLGDVFVRKRRNGFVAVCQKCKVEQEITVEHEQQMVMFGGKENLNDKGTGGQK